MPLDLQRLGAFIQGVGAMLEDPEKYDAFKAQFTQATKHTAVRLATEGGMPPELIARLKRDLGL